MPGCAQSFCSKQVSCLLLISFSLAHVQLWVAPSDFRSFSVEGNLRIPMHGVCEYRLVLLRWNGPGLPSASVRSKHFLYDVQWIYNANHSAVSKQKEEMDAVRIRPGGWDSAQHPVSGALVGSFVRHLGAAGVFAVFKKKRFATAPTELAQKICVLVRLASWEGESLRRVWD